MTKVEEWRALVDRWQHQGSFFKILTEALRQACDEVERLTEELKTAREHCMKLNAVEARIEDLCAENTPDTLASQADTLDEWVKECFDRERSLRHELIKALEPFARWADQSTETWWKESEAPLVPDPKSLVLNRSDHPTVQSLHHAAAVLAKARELDAKGVK